MTTATATTRATQQKLLPSHRLLTTRSPKSQPHPLVLYHSPPPPPTPLPPPPPPPVYSASLVPASFDQISSNAGPQMSPGVRCKRPSWSFPPPPGAWVNCDRDSVPSPPLGSPSSKPTPCFVASFSPVSASSGPLCTHLRARKLILGHRDFTDTTILKVCSAIIATYPPQLET